MITKTVGFKVGDKFFATIEDAQRDALKELLIELDQSNSPGSPWTVEELSNSMVEHSDKFIDILTTTEKSRPTARSVNGGKKPRKAKSVVQSVSGSQGAQVSSGEKIEQAK